MHKILIIDDEASILTSLYFALEDSFSVFTTTSPDEGMHTIETEGIDLVLLDQRLGEHNGIDVLRNIKQLHNDVLVIAMTAYGSIEESVEAIQSGAYYYVTKPLDISGIKILINKAIDYRILTDKVEDLTKQVENIKGLSSIVSVSESMMNVFRIIEKIRDLDINVLITGESGTGKELFARHVHTSSNRNNGPIEVINCAAIPNNLLESELFGYEKGAFTGATSRYKGKIELAHNGTLFLDEIGDMELQLQAKLLRVIQEKLVTPLGSTTPIPVNFRLIAATNKNLQHEAQNGGFREDLYFRLNEVPIKLPPLRERKDDIPSLVTHFLNKYSALYSRNITRLSNAAIYAVENYKWPGNVRELENVMKRAVALSSDEELDLRDLPEDIAKVCAGKLHEISRATANESGSERSGSDSGMSDAGIPSFAVSFGETIEGIVKKTILFTLNECGGNKRKTAGVLGMSERQLHNKLKDYNS